MWESPTILSWVGTSAVVHIRRSMSSVLASDRLSSVILGQVPKLAINIIRKNKRR
jgi:hypothetical protein